MKAVNKGGRPPIPWGKRFWSKINKTDAAGFVRRQNRQRLWQVLERWQADSCPSVVVRNSVWARLLICHRCNNLLFVRPKHLFKGTHQDNVYHLVHIGRKQPKRKPLTPGDIQEIKWKIAQLERQKKQSSNDETED